MTPPRWKTAARRSSSPTTCCTARSDSRWSQGQWLYLIDRRSRASKLDDITAAIAAAHRRGGHAYAVATQAYDPARAQWLTVQTGLAASDLDRFDPRPAFACNDVALVELLGGASP